MPVLDIGENRARLDEVLPRPGACWVIEHIMPDREQYAYDGSSGIEVCLTSVDNGQAALVLVSRDLEYRGAEPAIQRLFRAGAMDQGWRAVGRIRPPEPGRALHFLDALLGLDGKGVRWEVSDPDTHEVVVPAPRSRPQQERERSDEERFGQDLVECARTGQIGEIVGREEEIEALIRITSKLTKNTACLVGPAGVGKTAVAEGFALRIAQGSVPPALGNARILDVNLAFLAAGATYKNEFEGRFKELIDQARDDPHIILFFDELHMLCAPTNDVSQMVKADLGRGRIRCMGATTHPEWRTIEADAALARRFQVVPVAEPTVEQTLEILRRILDRLAEHHAVAVDETMLAEVVDLSLRYVPDRRLPDKAIDLLDEAAAYEAMQRGPGGDAIVQTAGAKDGQRCENGPTAPTDVALVAEEIQAAIAQGDYARAYALEARRRKGGQS